MKNAELGKGCMKYQCRRLHRWEEAIGPLERVWAENGFLNAIIGKIILILPPEMEETLVPLLGRKISILRTDLSEREYLVLTENERESEQNIAPLSITYLREDEQISNSYEVI